MSVTIQINGSSSLNSLVHKASNGVSTATLPDVCKTPSPGGPVPIPYPNISFSRDLANGTKTVTADGGNMIAIKGSEFSRSIGDEPGTAGGVKSSTNMKESKWLTYSFDVKMDGQNACRLSDKKTQNHANTVDAMGTVNPPVSANTCDLNIDCEEKKQNSGWDDCMVKELCTMIEEFNKIPKENIQYTPEARTSTDYHKGLAAFKARFANAVNQKPPNKEWIKSQFLEECAHDKWEKDGGSATPSGRGDGKFNPDHAHDAAYGGPLDDLDGMKWVSAKVNMTVGPAMKTYDPEKHDKVTASMCCE